MPWIYRTAQTIMLLALPLYIYVGFRLSTAIAIAKASKSSRLPISKKNTRIIVFAVIPWFYLWPIILEVYYLTGNFRHLFVYKPQLHWQDYLVLFPSWWGLISVVEIFPYFLALDIFAGVRRLKIFSSRKKQSDKKQPGRPWLSYLKIGIVLFFLFYAGIRAYFDTSHVRISTTEVVIKNLPKEFQGLRLCLFGDIHVNRYTQGKKLDKLKNTLQAGNEDLIFFTGDLIASGPDYIDAALNATCHPQGKLASTACMGDHDYWTAPNLIAREMRRCGWKFLQNQHRLIPYKGRQILVTGITYVYSQRISIAELERLLAQAPKADLKILIVHQPMEFLVETAARYGYHLLLGGHTHGGEVVNHFLGIPSSPGLLETRYCWGQHRFDGLKVVITNGIGRTLAALRYHAPAEITKLVLVKK